MAEHMAISTCYLLWVPA